jgi:hypothetical protein
VRTFSRLSRGNSFLKPGQKDLNLPYFYGIEKKNTRAKTQSTPSSEKQEERIVLCALASWREKFSCRGFGQHLKVRI